MAIVSLALVLGVYWSASPIVSAFLPGHDQSRGSTALRYFDDISRDHTFGWTPAGSPGQNGVGAGGAEEKMEAMQRRIFGHDVASASSLSSSQIEDETRQWIKDTGLVAGDLLGMETHDSSTAVACLASFWRTVVSFIDENADDNHPTHVGFLQIFPRCEELYDYDTLRLFVSAVEFCNSCTKYGRRFKLSTFHPRYKNAPKMIYPEHHSPFPSLGLHTKARAANDDEVGDEIVLFGETKESITSSNIADFVPQLSEKKRRLEILFNSPAAVSSVADSRSFGHTYQELLTEDVIAASRQWIADQSIDKPLKYMDTLIDDMIKVSDAALAEESYADLWEHVSRLYDAGKENVALDDEGDVRVMSSLFIAKKYASYNSSEFKRFAITVNAALKHLTDGKMFIELFHPEYVANRAGAKHASRRSPYPMIQICYRVRT